MKTPTEQPVERITERRLVADVRRALERLGLHPCGSDAPAHAG
jgi:hypothetical protein